MLSVHLPYKYGKNTMPLFFFLSFCFVPLLSKQIGYKKINLANL